MSKSFNGYVLRKPLSATSNSIYTAEPDTLVLDKDRADYTAQILNSGEDSISEYLVIPASTSNIVEGFDPITDDVPKRVSQDHHVYQINLEGYEVSNLVIDPVPDYVNPNTGIFRYASAPAYVPNVSYSRKPLKVWFTKNDKYQRFGFHNRSQRWAPLVGGQPDLLGTLVSGKMVMLNETLPVDTNLPKVRVGGLGGIDVPVTWEYDKNNWPPVAVPLGTAIAFADTGAVAFASDLIASYENTEVYQFRNNFFEFDDSTGYLGSLQGDLFLNPIPTATEYPLIRVDHRSYLEYNTDFTVDLITGKVTLSPTILKGDSVYYDGVYSTPSPTSSPTTSFATIINTSNDYSITLSGPEYDPDNLILYILETGYAVQEITWRNDVVDFKKASKLPLTRAEGHFDPVTYKYSFRISDSLKKKFNNHTLAIGTGDFLLEHGITFRMHRSLLDLDNSNNIPDAVSRVRVNNEEITDSINQGASITLPQLPIQDVSGYLEDVFFTLRNGLAGTPLIHGENVVYDFLANQLRWARTHKNKVKPIYHIQNNVKLDHEVLYNDNFEIELNTGNGYVPLTIGDTTQVNFDTGVVSFIETSGSTLGSGTGTGQGNDFTPNIPINLTSFTFPIAEDVDKPLLILSESREVFLIEGHSQGVLHLHKPVPTGSFPFEVVTPAEVVFRNGFDTSNLTKRWIFPAVTSKVSQGDFVPVSEEYTFLNGAATVPHIDLDVEVLGTLANTLSIPTYYRASTARYELFRGQTKLTKVANITGPDEYEVDSIGGLTFSPNDLIAYPASVISLEPQLSVGRTTGAVEVLASTREIGLPNDLTLAGIKLEVRCLLSEEDYTHQENTETLFFTKPLKADGILSVSYYTDAANLVPYETISLPIKETLYFAQGSNTTTFGANRTIDPNSPVVVFSNGSVISATVDRNNGTVTLSSYPQNKLIQIQYKVVRKIGGERIARLPVVPYTENAKIVEGTSQKFAGDHTALLKENAFMLFDDKGFEITQDATFDGEHTHVTIFPAADVDLEAEEIFIAQSVDRSPASFNMLPNNVEDFQITLFGDVTSVIRPSTILYLDSCPHYITGVSYNKKETVTKVTFKNMLIREYTNPSIEITDTPIYLPANTKLVTDNPIFGDNWQLVKFDVDNNGELLDGNWQYRVMRSGEVLLNPVNISAPINGERWQFIYTGQISVKPYEILGEKFFPLIKASYVQYISANRENKIMGASLFATYSFYNPDSFYFRVMPLKDLSVEVAKSFTSQLSSRGGPVTSFKSNLKNHDRGLKSFIWEEGDLRDRDRVGRRYLHFYNESAQALESYLQVVAGHVVGDRSGQFKYYLADDYQAGGEDPVTGEMIPYYANPYRPSQRMLSSEIVDIDIDKQNPFIRNQIDDLVLTNKKPYNLTLSGFEYIGTYKSAWEPHKISRFYPQAANIATITPPSRSSNPNEYSFLRDFRESMGDLQYEDILSISNLATRPARAWVNGKVLKLNNTKLRIYAGMLYVEGEGAASNSANVNLSTGDADYYIPKFSVGNTVNLGRIVYETLTNGEVTQHEVIYSAETSMVISKVEANYVEITVDGAIGTDTNDNTTYNGEPILLNDTLYADSSMMYRETYDYGSDKSEGELLNHTLPSLIAWAADQEAPDPLTMLDASVTFKNKLMEPKRFPALDGLPLDDDGLRGLPYCFPLVDSEVTSLVREEASLSQMVTSTIGSITDNVNVLNHKTLQFSHALEGVSKYNLLFIESVTSINPPWNSWNFPFYVKEVLGTTDVVLASFQYPQSNLQFEILHVYSGMGNRSVGNPSRWNSVGFDFTIFNGMNPVITIDGIAYTITSLHVGYVIVNGNIPNGAGPSFYIDLSANTGAINDLDVFQTGWDLSSFIPSSLAELVLHNTPQGGIYQVALLGNGTLETYPKGFDPLWIGHSKLASAHRGAKTIEGVGYRDVNPGDVWYSTEFNGNGSTVKDYFLNVFDTNNSQWVSIEIVSIHNGFCHTTSTIPLVGNMNNPVPFVVTKTNQYGHGNARAVMFQDLLHYDEFNGVVEIGQSLIIDNPLSEMNQGLYKVIDIDPTAKTIQVDRSFWSNVGTQLPVPTFPVVWHTFNPRRFSSELIQYQNLLLQKRRIYDEDSSAFPAIHNLLTNNTYVPNNPSTPAKSSITNLLDVFFGQPVIEGLDGTFTLINPSNGILESLTSNFILAGVREGAYVLLPQYGFFRVSNVAPNTLEISEGSENFGSYLPFISLSVPYNFKIFHPERFSERTYELILYEYCLIDEIIRRIDTSILRTIHDPNTLEGDPNDTQLHNDLDGIGRNTGVLDRLEWIRNSLIDEIDAILTGRESLYDLRFAWIDYRINMENGMIPMRQRFKKELAKRKKKYLKDLLKLTSTK